MPNEKEPYHILGLAINDLRAEFAELKKAKPAEKPVEKPIAKPAETPACTCFVCQALA